MQRRLDGAHRVTGGDPRKLPNRRRDDLRTTGTSDTAMSGLPQGGSTGRDVQGSKRPRVLGLGSAGVDFIALVDRYAAQLVIRCAWLIRNVGSFGRGATPPVA